MQLNKIMVPVDKSEFSMNAVKYSVDFSRKMGSSILLLHCHHKFPSFLGEPYLQEAINRILDEANAIITPYKEYYVEKEVKFTELMLEEPSIRWAPPVEISADNPLAVSCKDATREIRKTEPRLVGVPFGTDGIFFVKAGIEIDIVPSFGPGLIKLAHGPDEFVNVRSIPDSAKIFAITAIDYLNK